MPDSVLPEQAKKRIDACLANARDLLRAARRVLEDEKLPNICFHLAVLGLEEIGKAALLGARHIAQSADDETGSFDKRLDDHSFKLFWALWAPNLAHGNVSKDEFEKLRGMATTLHDERLDAMYVSFDLADGTPLRGVSESRAQTLLDLLDTRLGMEAARGGEVVDTSAHPEMKWFLEATADPEKRKLIFGQKAFDKLAEIGHMLKWMGWLKEQFDAAEAAGRDHLQRELARAVPDASNRGEEKWRIAIRLHSPSQSIRNRALNAWNARPTWIRLTRVGNDRHAVDVEFTYHEAMQLQQLGPISYRATRMFVAALNIGSLGFWWWHLPDDSGRFYERLTDLKAPPGMKIGLNMHSGRKFEWDREALDEPELNRVAMCFGMIAALDDPIYLAVVEPYLTGLALIAKSDLHLSLVPQASERFAAALLEAMRRFGDWDGTEDALAAGVSGFFGPRMQKAEDVQELLDLLRRLSRRPLGQESITMERAAILKVLTDAYLITQFDGMAQKMRNQGDVDAKAGLRRQI
jgi:AbiV family abortive infection protein